MAWIEIELDEQTFRALKDRAKRERVSVRELLSRIARREMARRDSPSRPTPARIAGFDSPASGRAFTAAPRRD